MDWKKLIAETQEYGDLTQPEIANLCGCAQATVSDLYVGKTKEPRHSLGKSLIDLHGRVRAKFKRRSNT